MPLGPSSVGLATRCRVELPTELILRLQEAEPVDADIGRLYRTLARLGTHLSGHQSFAMRSGWRGEADKLEIVFDDQRAVGQ
jgi:hypothetical protein